jgi:hypothetical protein
MSGTEFYKHASAVKQAYVEDIDFRQAAIASVLSAIKELKGSHSDEEVAVAICERLFGDS